MNSSLPPSNFNSSVSWPRPNVQWKELSVLTSLEPQFSVPHFVSQLSLKLKNGKPLFEAVLTPTHNLALPAALVWPQG